MRYELETDLGEVEQPSSRISAVTYSFNFYPSTAAQMATPKLRFWWLPERRSKGYSPDSSYLYRSNFIALDCLLLFLWIVPPASIESPDVSTAMSDIERLK